MILKTIHTTYRMAKRIVVLVVGVTVLLVGAALIVLPGPAFVVIPIGLAILSIEFAWARRWLKKVRETISENAAKLQARKAEARKDEAEE
ncbi:MAG: PGPGW domain-containing protein [Pseudomonadota bacterium]